MHVRERTKKKSQSIFGSLRKGLWISYMSLLRLTGLSLWDLAVTWWSVWDLKREVVDVAVLTDADKMRLHSRTV